jgi:DNA-binding HxlR family transcriptional regulator
MDDAEVGARCQIVRALDIVGEKWSLLIVRDALRGRTRFSEFLDSLGAPRDILSTRLAKLVDAGVLEKRPYREPGSRERSSYHLTESGRALSLVTGALLQWGERYHPYAGGAASVAVDADEAPVTVAFVDAAGRPVPGDEVSFVPGPGAVTRW